MDKSWRNLNMKLPPGKIAKLLGCTSMTVIRKRNRLKETGEIKRKPGSGRPQTLSDREQRNVWSCFHAGGVGPIKRIEGIMDGKIYHGILTTHAVPFIKSCIENKQGKEENKENKENKEACVLGLPTR